MFERRRASAERADSLTRALSNLDGAGNVSERNREYLDIAASLRPAESQSEAHRALLRDRLFRAPSAAEQRPDAGSRDGMESQTLHAASIGDPSIGMIRVADIEPIDPMRMIDVSERLNVALARLDETVSENGER